MKLDCYWMSYTKINTKRIKKHKMSKFRGPNVQHGDYGQHFCIIFFKVAKRIDLTYSHHKMEMIIM